MPETQIMVPPKVNLLLSQWKLCDRNLEIEYRS
jgi:hypothetical protein